MSARKVSKSLVNDIIAVATHQTQQVEFLRAALTMVSRTAADGIGGEVVTSPTLALVKQMCDEALLISEVRL